MDSMDFPLDVLYIRTPLCLNMRVYDTCSVGANLYAHNTRAAALSNDQHKTSPGSAPEYTHPESRTQF